MVSEFTLDAGTTSTGTLTVDTSIPATPAAPSNSAVVNGYVNPAHDTAVQALTGTAEDGSTVTISDNGTQVSTTTANASTGAWSFTIGTLADDSTHSYTVTATDAAGNVSQPSTALNFVVDTDASEQASLKLTVATTAISAAAASSVAFTIAGLDSEDTGTVTFTDVNRKTVVVNVNGGQNSYVANLSSLAHGTITSSLAVKTDTANNTFSPVIGTSIMLTQLDDGGFEPTSAADTATGGQDFGADVFTVGSTFGNGAWTVVQIGSLSGNVAVTSTNQFSPTSPPRYYNSNSGSQWLDLTGSLDNGALVGVQQSVATTSGTQYALSFFVGNFSLLV